MKTLESIFKKVALLCGAAGLLCLNTAGMQSLAGNKEATELKKEASEESHDAFGDKMTDKLNNFDDRIDSIEERVEKKGEATESELASRIADIKAKRQAAATQLNMMKSANNDTWKSMQKGVNEAFASLEQSVSSAEKWLQAH